MVGLMQVALLCLAPSPRDRPKMSTVHTMIEDIRTKGGDRNSIIYPKAPSISPVGVDFFMKRSGSCCGCIIKLIISRKGAGI